MQIQINPCYYMGMLELLIFKLILQSSIVNQSGQIVVMDSVEEVLIGFITQRFAAINAFVFLLSRELMR